MVKAQFKLRNIMKILSGVRNLEPPEEKSKVMPSELTHSVLQGLTNNFFGILPAPYIQNQKPCYFCLYCWSKTRMQHWNLLSSLAGTGHLINAPWPRCWLPSSTRYRCRWSNYFPIPFRRAHGTRLIWAWAEGTRARC